MIVAGSIEAFQGAPASSPARSGPLDVVPPNLKSCPQDSKKANKVNLLAFALPRYPRDKKKYRVFRWLGLGRNPARKR
jgi:hypothetical protein